MKEEVIGENLIQTREDKISQAADDLAEVRASIFSKEVHIKKRIKQSRVTMYYQNDYDSDLEELQELYAKHELLKKEMEDL